MKIVRTISILVIFSVFTATLATGQEDPASQPTTEPTGEPTTGPAAEPTTEPTAEPTTEPTAEPTTEPTAEPTTEPTAEPTTEPTEEPTAEPTAEPTTEPTEPTEPIEPSGFFGEEPQEPSEEYPDCVNDCRHAPEPIIFHMRDFQLDGIRGVIDGNRHEYRVSNAMVPGPDIDLFGIRGWGRMMVEITVEPAGSSSIMDPVITTHDGFKAITYNSDRAEGERTARAVVAHPYINGELPFYVVIEDATNYENFGPGGGDLVGGPEYGYIVRFATSDFAPTELGNLDVDNPQATVTGAHLEQGGDIHYYRFYAAYSARPTVIFTRTGSEAFVGVLAGMDTVGGQLVWERVVHDEASAPTGTVTLPSTAFDVCFEPCGEGSGEFIFAVLDWSGAAYPGAFTYDLTVTLQ